MRALIVGASSGIGAATARLLESHGWEVVGLDRTSGVAVEDRIRFRRAIRFHTHNAVDAVVYCAGFVNPKPLVDVDLAEWDHTLEVNVTGAFRVLQRAAEVGKPCAVILVASTAGTRPSPSWAAYGASKAALINLAESAAVELAPMGIRVYVVTPGRCATPLRATLAPTEDPSSIMQPREVAAVIHTLIGDHAGVLSGSPVRVAQ